VTRAQAIKHIARLEKAANELRAAVNAVPFGDVVGIVGHVPIADAGKSPGHALTLAACMRSHLSEFTK
jgi:hypothetical protein